MKKNTIKIGGKELVIGFAMSVVILYEKISGEVFNPTSTASMTTQMALCEAAIKRYNDFTDDWNDWLDSLSMGEVMTMQNALAECIGDFYAPMEEALTEDDGEKNA